MTWKQAQRLRARINTLPPSKLRSTTYLLLLDALNMLDEAMKEHAWRWHPNARVRKLVNTWYDQDQYETKP